MRQNLSKSFAWTVLAVCTLPFLLNLMGVDFASRGRLDFESLAGMERPEAVEAVLQGVSGSYVHTILEWSATAVALFTVLLAFTHFHIKRDVITPLIGVALLAAGCVDAFHTLAADRLITATADNRNLIPFTWAISRTFNAIIPITAFGLLLFARKYHPSDEKRRSFSLVIGVSASIGAIAYAVIHYCATTAQLPQTMYPGSFVTRPWDVFPLLVFLVSGAIIYPLFNKQAPSYFSQALWLSVLPDLATQLHMAFGSTALFDNHFNIAHSLKIVAYAVPCVGLMFDYVQTYRDSERAEALAHRRATELARSNQELDDFAYIASHDLKEPLRGIHNYATFLLEDYGDKFEEDGRKKLETLPRLTQRMETLIDSLLHFSRVGRVDLAVADTDLNPILEDLLDSVHITLAERNVDVHVPRPLPSVRCDRVRVGEIFRNLITNAIKYNDKPDKTIEIGCRKSPGGDVFYVRDNGIGIPEKHLESVFGIFKRLHGRDKFGGGTGAGLTITKKLVERHGGELRVESTLGEGSTFYFTLNGGVNGNEFDDSREHTADLAR